VLFQGYNCEFSQLVDVHGKTRLAGNGASLSRGATKFVDVDKLTQRALLCCPAAALQHSAREWPLHFALRLAAKQHNSAESVIITLKEH
jgi:hypothetical protein